MELDGSSEWPFIFGGGGFGGGLIDWFELDDTTGALKTATFTFSLAFVFGGNKFVVGGILAIGNFFDGRIDDRKLVLRLEYCRWFGSSMFSGDGIFGIDWVVVPVSNGFVTILFGWTIIWRFEVFNCSQMKIQWKQKRRKKKKQIWNVRAHLVKCFDVLLHFLKEICHLIWIYECTGKIYRCIISYRAWTTAVIRCHWINILFNDMDALLCVLWNWKYLLFWWL